MFKNVHTVYFYFSVLRDEQAEDNIGHCGLSGARFPDQRCRLALFDRKFRKMNHIFVAVGITIAYVFYRDFMCKRQNAFFNGFQAPDVFHFFQIMIYKLNGRRSVHDSGHMLIDAPDRRKQSERRHRKSRELRHKGRKVGNLSIINLHDDGDQKSRHADHFHNILGYHTDQPADFQRPDVFSKITGIGIDKKQFPV